ncbi:MAG: hypothetical protein ACOYW3_10170 [Bacteroidota bacterium]
MKRLLGTCLKRRVSAVQRDELVVRAHHRMKWTRFLWFRVAFSEFAKAMSLLGCLLLVSVSASAQQNLFNIPSGDITPKGKFFYQHQLNFYKLQEFETKSHLVLGLGKGWDGGVNLVDLPLRVGDSPVISYNDDSNRKPLYPLLMFTLQKQINLSKKVNVNLGTQVGPNISPNTLNKKFAFFNYVVLKTKLLKRINLVGGAYHTDNTFVGKDKHHFGFLAGYEVPLTKRFSLMGDMISGKHKKAQSTIGALYTVSKRTQLCAAALIDYPHGMKNHGLVLELNIFGWDIEMHH